MISRMTVLPGMAVYGADEAFVGVVEQVFDDGFLLHDRKYAFDTVAQLDRDRLIMREIGTHYHPRAKAAGGSNSTGG